MTLGELARMRHMRARPAFPVVMTDSGAVHEFCTANDMPVIWTPGLDDAADLSPLWGLSVWIVSDEFPDGLVEAVKTHHPGSLWVVGTFGYTGWVNNAIGREVL